MAGTPRPETVSTKQQRIAELRAASPEMAFTSLAHHIDIDWLHEAYRRTRKDGAVGRGRTDGDGLRGGPGGQPPVAARPRQVRPYQAPPVRRVHIPKGTRHRDPARSGFRPSRTRSFSGRSSWCWSRSTSRTSWTARTASGPDGRRTRRWRPLARPADGRWGRLGRGGRHPKVLRHARPRAICERFCAGVRDGVLLRLIGKWLNAGVLEDGSVTLPRGRHAAGRSDLTPAGEHLPALRAGRWFEQDVKPRLKGRAFLIRYADDFVMGFSQEDDARRVLEVLPKRFGKYGLTLHPEKTRLIDFRTAARTRPERPPRPRRNGGRSTCWASPTTGRSLGEGTG